MKRVLAIISRPPYAGAFCLETLEAAMVTQAFDLPTSILFRDAAVNALRQGQDTQDIKLRSIGKVVTALHLYDIENLYVCQASVDRYQLDTRTFVSEVRALSERDISKIIAAHDIVMGG